MCNITNLTLTERTVYIKLLNWRSNFWTRFAHNVLDKAKPKYSWQQLTVSILLVLNNFMKKLFVTKWRECRSDLFKGHASKPYKRTGIHLLLINCKALTTAPDQTQLNSTGWVESNRALWSQPATHLNSTQLVELSQVLRFWTLAVCPMSPHRPTRCVFLTKFMLFKNLQLSTLTWGSVLNSV